MFIAGLLLYAVFVCLMVLVAFKRETLSWVDFALPAIVIVFWVALVASGYGHQSLSHVIEVPIALIFALAFFIVKIFVGDKLFPHSKRNSYLVVVLSVIVVFLLRTLMPFLPE